MLSDENQEISMLEGSRRSFRKGVSFSMTKSSSSECDSSRTAQEQGCWSGVRTAMCRQSCYLTSAHLQSAMRAGRRNPSSNSLLPTPQIVIPSCKLLLTFSVLKWSCTEGVVPASCQTLQLSKVRCIQAKELRHFWVFPPGLQQTAVNDQNSPFCLVRSFVYLLIFKSV